MFCPTESNEWCPFIEHQLFFSPDYNDNAVPATHSIDHKLYIKKYSMLCPQFDCDAQKAVSLIHSPSWKQIHNKSYFWILVELRILY